MEAKQSFFYSAIYSIPLFVMYQGGIHKIHSQLNVAIVLLVSMIVIYGALQYRLKANIGSIKRSFAFTLMCQAVFMFTLCTLPISWLLNDWVFIVRDTLLLVSYSSFLFLIYSILPILASILLINKYNKTRKQNRIDIIDDEIV